MTSLTKLSALSVLAALMILVIKKQSPELALILSLCACALGAILVYADVANNLISYGACFIAAAELFVLALLHISFQSRIAKRPLPQFNKKGAGYDEN